MSKAAAAFRTISEVAEELDIPKHVLRFWELKFPQLKPMKRGGGRRYYRPEDLELLRGIRHLLHADGYTIKGVQKILREQGVEAAKAAANGKRPAMASALGDTPRKPRKSKRTTAHTASKTSPKSKSGSKRKGVTTTKSRAAARPSPAVITAALESAIKELQICRDILRAEPMVAAAASKKSRPRARAAR